MVKAQALPAPIAILFAQSLEPPPETSAKAAVRLLQNLGALTPDEEVTSLGRILAALPVQPRNGKMLLMGILFRCLEPMLILSAAEYDEPSWSGPEVSRRELDKAVQPFAGDSESDQIGMINCFRECDAARTSRGQGQIRQDAEQVYVREHVYQEMRVRLNEVYDDLSRVGLLSPRYGPYPLGAIPHQLNKNAKKMNLIKASIVSGLEPNIVAWLPGRDSSSVADSWSRRTRRERPGTLVASTLI